MLPEKRQYNIARETIRHLDITDSERIERFRRAGYGGNVSDSLWELGVCDTVLSQRFKPPIRRQMGFRNFIRNISREKSIPRKS